MSIEEWLRTNINLLDSAGISTARLDCVVMLEDVLGKERSLILAHQDDELNRSQLKKLDLWIKRRLNHEPLAYIRGKTEFYGREFAINKDVLEPRPESETIIDLLKSLDGIKRIADIGTGSGALAITAKLELPELEVTATDIDKKCLVIAAQNIKKHDVQIELLQGDLLSPVSDTVDVIIANLPYVPDDFTLNEAAMNEPKIAIFGGKDGLDLYKKLFKQLSSQQNKPKYLLTESLPIQHSSLEQIAARHGYNQQLNKDFIQLFSFVQA